MKLYQLLVILLLAFSLSACSQTTQPGHAGSDHQEHSTSALAEDKMEDMDHKMEGEGMEHGMEAHQAVHRGQVGMAMNASKNGTDFHFELVSDTPGQYILYLSDNNREPVSPKGYKGTVAVIRPDGSEIASMPLMAMADHLMAEGGPTNKISQLDVRVTVDGPDLVDVLEMDFTLLYEE